MVRLCLVVLLLLTASPALGGGYSYDFESGRPDVWSKGGSLETASGKVLGPFNNRNTKYRGRTDLRLEGLEARPYTLSFDLVLFGNWECAHSAKADRVEVEANGVPLLKVDEFDCNTTDKDELLPKGTPGAVHIGNRWLGTCVQTHTVPVAAEMLEDNGDLRISFRGRVSGRRSEFWALDNVRLEP